MRTYPWMCFLPSCISILPTNIIKDTFLGIPPTVYHDNLNKLMPPYLSFPGLLCPRASLYSSQPLQTRVCWWQQDYRTSVCGPAQLHGPCLGVQCDGSPCLASSQRPQAAGISRGPVLCGGMPFSWFHLWAGSLPLHQQQGGPARVGQPKVMSTCVTREPPGWKPHTYKCLVPTSDLSLPRYTTPSVYPERYSWGEKRADFYH